MYWFSNCLLQQTSEGKIVKEKTFYFLRQISMLTFYDLQTNEQFKPQKLEVFQDHFLYKTIYIFASVMFHGMRWSRFLYLSQIYRLQGHQT